MKKRFLFSLLSFLLVHLALFWGLSYVLDPSLFTAGTSERYAAIGVGIVCSVILWGYAFLQARIACKAGKSFVDKIIVPQILVWLVYFVLYSALLYALHSRNTIFDQLTHSLIVLGDFFLCMIAVKFWSKTQF